ncbi:YdeI/OmpD-associated family protein [Ichthyenterobacterium sp. W332]|uniref:YdeI/OmpD-associated family protein n=1 Tax=Microcosmobacter mediterraneus TaxID=3075607 RepID=A0ABU2YLW7_9FLAO|nr:YdeI/OmpD-associated family protein [Ichthyenterobacterium sp. W332]MDT0559143.1 YdeI/OmpD-associated family protein [Ichthyenterobacterium sp. W332]
MEFPELYFERDIDWYDWLLQNHDKYKAVYLVFYKLETGILTMRWSDAVKVALCFGWIDATVKSLGGGKRIQYFTHRNPKSTWSALNKKYIVELEATGMIQEPGWKLINLAKETGTWTEMDDVENGVIPDELQKAFDVNPRAFENYQNFSKGYRKSYLSWLHSAKREATKQKRIKEIIRLCNANIKSRDAW